MTEQPAPQAPVRPRKTPRPWWWRLTVSVVRIVVIVFLVFSGLMFFFQSYFIFRPKGASDDWPTPRDWGMAFEQLTLTAADGTGIDAWYVPCDNPAARTVIVCHGNAGNITHRLDTIQTFNLLDVNVLIFDYRGYGRSEGSPSEDGTYQDAEAAWQYLVETRNVAPERIVIFGRSLGGGVAAHLAHTHTPGALILESTFTSMPDAAASIYPFLPVRWLCRISYDIASIIRRIDCPILVVHSRDDEMLPFEFGQALYEAAKEPKQFLEIHGSHNCGMEDPDATYTPGLQKFFASLDAES